MARWAYYQDDCKTRFDYILSLIYRNVVSVHGKEAGKLKGTLHFAL